jgi:CheY-like chemotaxis protein
MPGVVSSPLAGLRILVVEDEVFIAWEIEERLQRLGCEVVGPVGHLEHALQLARSTALDGALLDVNIKGGVVYPVAAELLALPAVFRDLPCLRKPFGAGQLESIAHEAFLGPRGKPTPR